MALGLNDFDEVKSITRAIGRGGPYKSRLFWAQMAFASLFVYLLSLPVCRRSSLLTGEGGGDGDEKEQNNTTARKPGPL
jgi:hypothetical protein